MREESPFACEMGAIAPEQRGAHITTIERLFGAVQNIRELPDGYAFELPNESDVLLTASEFIINERLCCPFLEFNLNLISNQEPVSLSLRGPTGTQEFLRAEFGGAIS